MTVIDPKPALQVGDKITFRRGELIVSIDYNDKNIVMKVRHEVPTDRKDLMGWSFENIKGRQKLSERLKRAIEDCKVFVTGTIAKDVNGKTYINSTPTVWRNVNADLKKIGY